MSKESRSRGGCWTCRARRKKCDESRPHCSLCLSLGIQCHGYAEKPAWMDGAAKEEAELSTLARKVAKTIQRRKLSIRRFSAREGALPSPSPTEPLEDATVGREKDLNDGSPQQHNSDTEAVDDMVDIFPEPFNHPSSTRTEDALDTLDFVPELYSSPGTTLDYIQPYGTGDRYGVYSNCNALETVSMPLLTGLPMPFSLEDSGLFVHYFDQLCPWQFRYQFVPQSPFSKEWLLWFMLRNRPLYLIILSLSATDQALFRQKNCGTNQGYQDELVKQYHEGIQALQVSLCTYESRHGTCEELLHILLCIIMLMFQDILRSGTGNWSIHLEAALSILEPEFNGHVPKEADCQLNANGSSAQPNNFGFSVMSQIMWFHILSSISLFPGLVKIHPQLSEKYTTILKSGRPGTDLRDIVGCQNCVIISILSIYSLRDWKTKAESAGPVSLWALTEKASTIRRDLDNCLQETNGSAGSSSSLGTFPQNVLITEIFARAALVLLNVVTSGPHPCLDEIEKEVTLIIGALKNLPDPSLLQYLAWPFCIAGCMARVVHYPFFVGLEQQYAGPRTGVLANAVRVVQRCWSLREMIRDRKGVDWSDALESLHMGLLFF